MNQGAELEIKWVPPGRGSETGTIVFRCGVETYTDRLNIENADRRVAVVNKAVQQWPSLDSDETRSELVAELERIASKRVQSRIDGGTLGSDEDAHRQSQADSLVALAESAELFHTPGGHDSEAFATIVVGDHRETWPLQSKAFRRWLARQFYLQCEKAPSTQALVDAMNVLIGKALYEGSEYRVALRLARSDEEVWLDLADAEWRAVRVTGDGWSVVPSTEVPIRFKRRRGMLPLPVPVPGGQIDELRDLVNLPDDDAWMLFVAFLIGALSPSGPYPILVINGEHGSAKSTLCRFARSLIDPNMAPLRRPTRDDRDLMIAANNGWIIGYDNLSRIPASMSDALCALATGSGFGTRELYSDDEEKLFSAARPIMVNGITDLATRSDLLDRAVQLVLRPIPDERRRDEAALHAEFDAATPRLLGALLDAVSAALRNRASVRLETMPRMADFAIWVTAAEPALGWEPGRFLKVYGANRARANDLALEASPVATAVLALLESVGEWHGSATELLAALEVHIDEHMRKDKEWPKSARGIRAALDRAAPNLRAAGITVETGNRASTRNRTRIIGLKSSPTRPSEPSRPSESPPDAPPEGDTGGRSSGRSAHHQNDDRPTKSRDLAPARLIVDGSDGSDGCAGGFSGRVEEEGEWTG